MRLSFRPFLAAAVAVASAALAPSHAAAAVAYSYAAGMSTYTAGAVGQSVSVPIYLYETLTDGSASLLNAQNGLAGAGTTVTRTGAGTAAISGLTLNPAFSGPSLTPATTATVARFTESAALGAQTGVAATAVSATVNRVLLANVAITAAASPTTFSLTPYVNGNGSTGGNTLTFSSGYDLDPNRTAAPAYTGAAAAATSFVVAVPEPTSLAAIGALAVGGLLRRRKVD